MSVKSTNSTPIHTDKSIVVQSDKKTTETVKPSVDKSTNPTILAKGSKKLGFDLKTSFQNLITLISQSIKVTKKEVSKEEAKTFVEAKAQERKNERLDRRDAAILEKAGVKHSAVNDVYVKGEKTGDKKIEIKGLADKFIMKEKTDHDVRLANCANLMSEIVSVNKHFGVLNEKGIESFCTKFVLESGKAALKMIDVAELNSFAQILRGEGRKDIAFAVETFATVISLSRTKEGAEELYSKLSEQATKPTSSAGTYMRDNNIYTLALSKMLNAQGLESYAETVANTFKGLKGEKAQPFEELATEIAKPRQKREFENLGEGLKPNGKVDMAAIKNVKDDGITKEEADLFITCGKSFIEILSGCKAPDDVKATLKVYADRIQDKVGTGEGKISQDDANKMIHTLYSNCIMLRSISSDMTISVKLTPSKDLPTKDSLLVVLNFIQQISNNGMRNSDVFSETMKTKLEEEGKNITNQLDNVYCDVWGMPKTARIYTA